MFCEKCGKENEGTSNFCASCGAPLTPPQPQTVPAAPPQYQPVSYTPPRNSLSPELQKYASEQKSTALRQKTARLFSASSILFLIAGILQCLLGIRFETMLFFELNQMKFSFNTVGTHLKIPFFVAFSLITLLTLFSGYVFIMLFVRHRYEKENILRFKKGTVPYIFFAVVSVAMYILERMLFNTYILNLVYLFMSLRSEGHYFSAFMTAAQILLFLTALISATASVTGIIGAAKVKRGKGVFADADELRSKKRRTSVFVTVSIMLLLSIGSLSALIGHYYNDSAYYKAQTKLENIIKNGYLDGYREKTIDAALNDGDSIHSFAERSVKDPWHYNSAYPISDSDSKRYIKLSVLQSTDDDGHPYKNIDLTLCYDTATLKITVDDIIIEGTNVTNSRAGDLWIDSVFGDSKMHALGKDYVKKGVYVSSSDTLYSSPSYDFKIPENYAYSGTKTVYDYQISEDGSTLWLNLHIQDGEITSDVWLPKRMSNKN